MKETLGQRVKDRRLELGLTVQELAQRAGVSASYIYAIEVGARGSHVDKLVRIAEALGVSLLDIIHEP